MSGGNLVLVPLLYADGTPFKGANGGVLVEVVASVLPAGAATDAGLQAILTAILNGNTIAQAELSAVNEIAMREILRAEEGGIFT